MPRFQGIPLEADVVEKPRFAGIPIDQPANQQEADNSKFPLFSGDINQLEEIGAAPELNKFTMDAFKSSAAASLIGRDEELADALGQLIPEAKFTQDAQGNVVAELPSGQFALNKPGLSGQDVSKFLTRAGLFALTMGKAKGVNPATLLGLAGKGAATEAALQGVESALGGEVNKTDIAIAGAAAPVGQVVGEKVVAPRH
jgi:hypothetical protein